MDFVIQDFEEARWIELAGNLNEDSEQIFKSLFPKLEDADTLVFNFKNIKSIRTWGVRAWVNFLRMLEGAERRTIYFAECTPEVIMQINLVPNFQGTAKILSFYVVYYSPATNKQISVLYEMKDLAAKTIPPVPNCPDTGVPMLREELEDEYFMFLYR